MARKEMDQAMKNNQKIFPIFQKRLSTNDMAQWLSTANKFATWLDSDKAYYSAARPHVTFTSFYFLLHTDGSD